MLADLILILHFAYVAFVVGGLAIIWVGFAFRSSWVRHWGFRLAHLLAMGIVLAEVVCGVNCPLTVWENALRARAGGAAYGESFLEHWLRRLMFHDWSETTFLILYAAVFGLILLTFLVAPPRWPGRSQR